jgi:hypothetical protein
VAKKDEMFSLAKDLGEEAMDDPSLLHPLFARLPPLYPDTPSSSEPPPQSASLSVEDGMPNPYSPIPLSRLFQLTDELMARYPWDGDVIRGREVMGEGSAIWTYDQEGEMSVGEMLGMMEKEVVRPGAADMDEEEEEEEREEVKRVVRRRFRLRVPRQKMGMVLAIGVLVVGVGLGTYGRGTIGTRDLSRWWGSVITVWVGKRGLLLDKGLDVANGYGKVLRYVRQIIRDII